MLISLTSIFNLTLLSFSVVAGAVDRMPDNYFTGSWTYSLVHKFEHQDKQQKTFGLVYQELNF